jgi:hypothetical protein
VVIGVSSLSVITRTASSSTVEEHPPYVLLKKVPSQSIRNLLTPDSPDEIQRGTFDLRLTPDVQQSEAADHPRVPELDAEIWDTSRTHYGLHSGRSSLDNMRDFQEGRSYRFLYVGPLG